MNTDATTTDGFRVGQRVRVWGRGPEDPFIVLEGTVLFGSPGRAPVVRFGDGSVYTCSPLNRIELLPDATPSKPSPQLGLGCRVRVAPGQKTTIADELCVIIGRPAEDAWEIESLETGLTSTGFYDHHLIFVSPLPKPINRDVLIIQPGVRVTLRDRDEAGRNLPAGQICVSHLNPLARTWRGYRNSEQEWMTEFDAKDVSDVSMPDDEPDAPATPEPAATSENVAWKGKPGVGQMLMDMLDHIAEGGNITPEPPKPPYYARLREAGCEPFAVIRGAHSRDWAIGYHVGTAEAYLLRCQHKHDSPDDDIRKAHAHLAEAVAILDAKA